MGVSGDVPSVLGLRGQEAMRKHQCSCRDCQFWHAKPDVPKMVDLPPSRLCIYTLPFYSTGDNGFGPFDWPQDRKAMGYCV